VENKILIESNNESKNSLDRLVSDYISKNMVNSTSNHIANRKSDTQTRRLLSYLFTGTRGSANRLRIILLLSNRPFNAHQISKELELDYNAIQFHMGVLEKNNLVSKTGQRYGAMFFLSTFLEYNMDAFNEIVSKFQPGET
jgi:DNA-binding transcriptional ArsR family regulator